MQNQQFISEEERAAYAKIEAPMLGYRRLDMMDNDRGSAPNPVVPNGGAAVSPPNSAVPNGDTAVSSPHSAVPSDDTAVSPPNSAVPSGGAGAAAPGRCSGKARP